MSARVVIVTVNATDSPEETAAPVETAMSQMIGDGFEVVSVLPINEAAKVKGIMICGQQ